jgi:NADH-quinone oxidoreductase subunit E
VTAGDEDAMELCEAARQEIDRLVATCQTQREAIVQVLETIQCEHGHVDDEAVSYVANRLKLGRADVEDVLTFYPVYHRRPVGKYVVKVCRSLPCARMGAAAVAEHLSLRLGLAVGETSPDGRFTLLEVECLGLCDRAPAMMINDDVYGPLTPEGIDQVLASLRDG